MKISPLLLNQLMRVTPRYSRQYMAEAALVTTGSVAVKSIGSFARIIDANKHPDFKLPQGALRKREFSLLGLSALATYGIQLALGVLPKKVLSHPYAQHMKYAMAIPPLIMAEYLSRKFAYKDIPSVDLELPEEVESSKMDLNSAVLRHETTASAPEESSVTRYGSMQTRYSGSNPFANVSVRQRGPELLWS